MAEEIRHLTTPFSDMETDLPWKEYPRPNFRRESYQSLNGEWDFLTIKNSDLKRQKILVPFPPESLLSGVNQRYENDTLLCYAKSFTLPEGFRRGRVLLHFEAVDGETHVYVNDQHAGEHIGGYCPFSLDITDLLEEEENSLKVTVSDNLHPDFPYGKQRRNRGGMWYTEVSGIWGSVWLESVPETFIERIKFTPDLTGVGIEVVGGEKEKKIIFEGKTYEFSGDSFYLEVENPKLWTPEEPHLYDLKIISGEDEVDSYFALRTVNIRGDKILLNGKPYFFHGLLDQGYFSDGIYLGGSEEALKNDILTAKKCGFNCLRKHIKVESRLFYYYCDSLGMAVFQDIVNSGKYSFLLDTALPTVFLKKGISHHASKRRKEQFEKNLTETVEHLYNHPSVVYYTLFNEGWGQFNTKYNYTLAKSLDSTRVWDAASGWFENCKNDVISPHVYFKPVKIKPDGCRPVVLSEFGGYSCKIPEHSFNLSKTYGYKYFEDTEEFETALISLYEKEIIPAIESGLSGAILTQLSDVEDETNGLITYDRHFLKVHPDKMQALAEKLFAAFKKTNE